MQPIKPIENQNKAKEYWAYMADEELLKKSRNGNFSRFDITHHYHNDFVHGDPTIPYLNYFYGKYCSTKKPKIASMGCGNGHLERTLASFGWNYDFIDGYEFNATLVQHAKDMAIKNGLSNIKYHYFDLNNDTLNKNHYDVVIFFHSLHHVENLELCLESVRNSLNNDGIMLLVEYVGPSKMKIQSHELQTANQILQTIPEELRINHEASSNNNIIIKNEVDIKKIESYVILDPTEAIRSSEILPLANRYFNLIELKPLAGTMAMPVLDCIAGNFDETNSEHLALLKNVFETERTLLMNRQIDPHYVFAVYQKPWASYAGAICP